MVWTLPASSPALRKEGDSARYEDARISAGRGKRHHHGGESLIARSYPEHAFPRRQRAHQAAKDDSRVVAVSERVEHAVGALRPAVAGVGDGSGKGDGVAVAEFAGGLGDEQPDLPVAGVKAERDRSSIRGPHSPVGREDKKLGVEQAGRLPAHARVLREPKKIPGGLMEQHLRRDRQRAGWPRSVGLQIGEEYRIRVKDLRGSHDPLRCVGHA